MKHIIHSYLGEIGTYDDLALFDQAMKTEDRSTYRELFFAKVSIISRKDSNEAFNLILSLSSDLISDPMISILKRDASKLQSSLLLKALDHYSPSLKVFAIDELETRGELTQELATSMLQNSNIEMKEKLYKFLIKKGWKGDIDQIKKEFEGSIYLFEDILYSIYSKYSDDGLKNDLDWLNMSGPIIYKVLGLRNYEIMKTKIFTDLDNNFQDYYHKCEDDVKRKYGELGLEFFKPELPIS